MEQLDVKQGLFHDESSDNNPEDFFRNDFFQDLLKKNRGCKNISFYIFKAAAAPAIVKSGIAYTSLPQVAVA